MNKVRKVASKSREINWSRKVEIKQRSEKWKQLKNAMQKQSVDLRV